MLPSNIHILIGERYHHPLLQLTAKLICAEHPIISRSFNPCPITVHMVQRPLFGDSGREQLLIKPGPRMSSAANCQKVYWREAFASSPLKARQLL